MQADQSTVVKSVLWTGVGLLVALVIASLLISGVVRSNAPPTNAEFKKMIGDKFAELEFPVYPDMPDMPEFPDYMINERQYEKQLMEERAEELALDELNSKDFKRFLLSALQGEIDTLVNCEYDENEHCGLEIESYKDIEDVYSVDVEDVNVKYRDETATVEIEFKVKYVLDDDEDLIGKAKIIVIYDVSELVVDDDFEDAEVSDLVESKDIYLYKNLI